MIKPRRPKVAIVKLEENGWMNYKSSKSWITSLDREPRVDAHERRLKDVWCRNKASNSLQHKDKNKLYGLNKYPDNGKMMPLRTVGTK